MKRSIIAVLPMFFWVYACHSTHPQETSGYVAPADTAKKNYLPVADYLKSEIANVDSFPFKLMRYRVNPHQTDSGIITTAVFNQIAAEFLLPDLDSSRFEKNFEENSFIDRTTNLV